MFFAKKNRDRDIQEIKKAVDEGIDDDFDNDLSELPELDFDEPPVPKQRKQAIAPEKDFTPRRDFMQDFEPLPAKRKDQMAAPLFVKVDKYRELLTTVHEMKLFVSGLKQTFNVLEELETIRTEAIKVMRASVQRLERSVLEMDNELLRPRGIDFTELVESESEVKHMEDSLTDLENEVASLRRELQDLR